MSFFGRPKPHVLPITVFGGLAAVIILATAHLVIKAAGREGQATPFTTPSGTFAGTPAAVVEKYAVDLTALHAGLADYSGSREEFFAFVENALLSMRVPKEMLDAHIAAVLRVRAMHSGNPDGKGDEHLAVQREVRSLLDRNALSL